MIGNQNNITAGENPNSQYAQRTKENQRVYVHQEICRMMKDIELREGNWEGGQSTGRTKSIMDKICKNLK